MENQKGIMAEKKSKGRGEMPFLDHLEELRWRILWSLLAVVVGTVIGFVFVYYFGVMELLVQPLRRAYGEPEWGVTFEDGTPIWDYFDDAWYLRKHPEKEIGLLTFSNGKNDGGIGWPQAVRFYEALEETRRPHIFVWGQRGHGQRARMPVSLGERVLPIDVRTDQSLPAFSQCSLDDDPGNGDPNDGDAEGQVNLYLAWDTEDLIDQRTEWAVTVRVIPKAPEELCTVDITPRRLQNFPVQAGDKIKWTSTAAATGEVLQSGTTSADRWGLVTLEKVRVTKSGNRIRVFR